MTNGSGSKTYCQDAKALSESPPKIIDCLSKRCSTATLAGIPWRDLPERFGEFRVVHTRFSRWSKTGVWERMFQALAEDADNEYAMIDSTIVRAHQHSAGAKGGSQNQKRLVAARAD